MTRRTAIRWLDGNAVSLLILSCLLGVLAIAIGCTGNLPPGCPPDCPLPTPTPEPDEPTPTPEPPPPTPTPTPEPEPACIAERIGWAACCDSPDTPDRDEGYEAGWPTATGAHLDRVARESRGCVTDIEFRTGPYAHGVGGDYPQYGPDGEPPDWNHLTARVQHANLRGMLPWLDVGDCWAINIPSRNPIGLRPQDMRGELNPFYRDHALAVARASCGQGLRAAFETGNECWFKGEPSRAWEEGIIDAVRSVPGCEDAPFRSNSRTGVENTRVGVALASHGFPGRGFEPPLQEPGGWLSESDNESIGPALGGRPPGKAETLTTLRLPGIQAAGWRSAVLELDARGVTVVLWPGPVHSSAWDQILRAMVADAEPEPPPPDPTPSPEPTPPPPPPECEPLLWPNYCGEHRPGDPILHEDVVREAVRSVLARDPRFHEGQSLPEDMWVAYAQAVTDELNSVGVVARRVSRSIRAEVSAETAVSAETTVAKYLAAIGVCASKDTPPVPSKEEVAVWASPQQREHHDLVVGHDNRIGEHQMFLAWLCVDGRQ